MSSQDLVSRLLSHLSFPEARVDVAESADVISINIDVTAADSGVLIGYHGETIDALQFLVSLMLNQGRDHYIPVEVDINGYRAARKRNLEDLADQAALKAVQSGREIILPPLSSRERRLVHLHLSARSDVSTYSEGEGTSRRLVVRPAAA